MIKVGVQIKGLKTLEGQFDALLDEAKKSPLEAVTKAALAIHANAIKNIRENNDGPIQVRYGEKGKSGESSRREVHVSQPFDFPNSDTGRLINSIQFEVLGGEPPVALVGSNLDYAKFLEFGTRDMAPRPWLGLAARNEADTIKKHFQAVSKDMATAIKKAGKKG